LYLNESFVQVIKIMRAKVLFLIGIILLCVSCKDSSKRTIGSEVYKVNLNDVVNPFDEVFSKAEIIPLETSELGLLSDMQKINMVGGNLYIYDFMFQTLTVFDQTGKFIQRIGKRGQGPEDYLNMYDCYIDIGKKKIYSLSVFGTIKQYQIDGTFEEDIVLPARPNYYSIALLDDRYIATWSCLMFEEEGSLGIVDRLSGDTIGTYWHDDPMFNFQLLYPFHRYENKTFFSTALRQQVYEVTPKGLFPAYSWDFGKDNIGESTLKHYLDIEDINDRNLAIIEDCGSYRLPFCLREQRQNKKYSYVALKRDMNLRPPLTHVFYDKTNHRGYAFDELADGCRMNYPLYFGEDFILTDVFYENREQYKSILPESEYKKLENMKEDDNPCLLKLYFK